MHEKDSPFPIANSHGRLECKELWGGIRNRDIVESFWAKLTNGLAAVAWMS